MSEAEAQPYEPNWSMNDVLAYQRERAEQKRRCDVENGLLRNIDKRAKEQGLPVEVIRAVDRVRKREKPEAEVYLKQFLRISTANGIVAGPQLNLWTQEGYTPTDEEAELAAENKASDEGFKAGRGGLPKDANRYAPGTAASQAWVKWWARGVEAEKHITGGRSVVASREQPKARQRAQPPKKAAPRLLPAPAQPPQTLHRDNVVPIPKPVAKRGRGRPKGSRNKPKAKRG